MKLKLKALTLIWLSFLVAACATRGSEVVREQSKQFDENVNAWFAAYRDCEIPFLERNQLYFLKVISGPYDTRKVQLLTNNESISKQFKAATPDVVAQLDQCILQSSESAQKFNQQLSSAILSGLQKIDAVYIDMVNGKYKTYGQFNQALFAAYTSYTDKITSTIKSINADYVARFQAELQDENYRTSMALMMFGAGMKNAANASQNSYNNVRNAAPVTTNCRAIGGTLSCSSY